MKNPRIGIWLIGAKGGVGSTAILGVAALKQQRIPTDGLVSSLPQFQSHALTNWSDFVVGGHEIRGVPLFEEAMRMATANHIAAPELVEHCRAELNAIDQRIRPGTIQNVGPAIASLAESFVPRQESPCEAIDRLAADMVAFVQLEQLAHLVVVNVSSTEPPVDTSGVPSRWSELEQELNNGHGHDLPASSLYAIAALRSGYSYLNFTPSLGPALPAIDELASLRRTRYYGCDGKTGETLMKSVLAPMFARRNLRVLSWVGHNIFGNMDAQVLDDPANKKAKIASKDHLVGEILGYRPQTLVSIERVDDMGDWKTAWDHIHYSGFLGLPMTLQFIWQGCDSVLAAPLVLDLVRFTELAWRRGHVGSMPFLASFFKSPYGVAEHAFDRQFQTLEAWSDPTKNNGC
jgi:myo-inositol-1-phosphate synthase